MNNKAKRQKKYTLLEFVKEFAGREIGTQEYFDPGHASEIIKMGSAVKVDSGSFQNPDNKPDIQKPKKQKAQK
jgi:hypothetical protein